MRYAYLRLVNRALSEGCEKQGCDLAFAEWGYQRNKWRAATSVAGWEAKRKAKARSARTIPKKSQEQTLPALYRVHSIHFKSPRKDTFFFWEMC